MNLQGVKLYTAEWYGDSRGWKLDDPWSRRYLEECLELGIKNIHVHKGPTIWPLDRDAFDVADIDKVATDYTELNFIVEHVGLPRLEDFCWIATQEPNVYGGLAVAMPFIHSRPKYFAQIIGELLYWIGEDRILFSSDYALWTPKWLVEKFVDFQIPADMHGVRAADHGAEEEDPRPERGRAVRPRRTRGAPAARWRRVAGRSRGVMIAVDRSLELEAEVVAALATVIDPELDEPSPTSDSSGRS